jgi:formylglycine-generating enzyme required for sulfatase activity
MESTGQDPGAAPAANDIVTKCVCTKNGGEIKTADLNAVYRDTTYIDTSGGKSKKRKSVERCSEMPVTGVSYEQAKAFCEWLSDEYAGDSKYNSLELNFRLPTPAEMDSLLSDIVSQWPKGSADRIAYEKGINSHGCALYNFKHNSWCDNNVRMKKAFGYGVPMRSGFFFADFNGLLDVMGNVAEMTSEKGVAKGGSCIDTAAQCQSGAVNSYDSPKVWLGFRVVADLKQ